MRKKNTKIGLLIAAALLLSQPGLYGQEDILSDVNLPELVPPSPEAAGFIRGNYGSANFSTGAVNATIPLYTIQVKQLSWPLSLSYSSQGMKVDEASSRVGYGWTLNAGGMITRIVRDDPDELATPIARPAVLGLDDSANFFYCRYLTADNGYFDSQPDEYLFSFNGHSGKFVFDSSGNAVVTSHSNLKIETFPGREHFVITTTDGVRYKFGGSYDFERTIDHNYSLLHVTYLKTTFFLYRIEIPGGEWINFNYNNITIQVTTGITQTLRLADGGVFDPCDKCKLPGNFIDFAEKASKIEYQTRYLGSITTSNGVTVSFHYQARPDATGDNRVSSISVEAGATLLKFYRLSYYDPPGLDGSHLNIDGTLARVGRFFLVRLSDVEMPEGNEPLMVDSLSHDHVFTYHDPANAPKTFIQKQDHWGFYNSNTGNLIPVAGFWTGTHPYMTGNRNPVADSAIKGILRSITYPTGGKEEFFYEQNTIYDTEQVPFGPVMVGISGNYQGSNTHYSYYSGSFMVPYQQQVTLEMSSSYLGTGIPQVGGRIVQFYLKEGGDTIYHNYLYGDATFQSQKTLYPGRVYSLEMKIRNDYTNAGQFWLSYDTTQNPAYVEVNRPFGGVRLRKIRYSSPETGQTHNRFYTYAGLENLSRSSGMGIENPEYRTAGFQSFMCPDPGYWGVYALCNYAIYSSNTSFNVFRFSGSHIYYTRVIESDDSLLANGGTEYSFYSPAVNANATSIRGAWIPHMPEDNAGNLNGVAWKTRQFDRNLQQVTEQMDYYDTVQVGQNVQALAVHKHFEPNDHPGMYSEEMTAFDMAYYHYQDLWYRKRASVTRSFASNQESGYDSTVYVYGPPANVLPAEVHRTSSMDEPLKTVMKYPTDYIGVTVADEMISRNMIGEPVEVSAYVSGVLHQQKKVSFRNWLSAHDVIRPDTIRVKAATDADVKDALYFERYDSSGNVLQARKADDAPVSYIWDHKKTFPIAQVTGAAYDQVAYTSFEGDGWGNWKPVVGGAIHTHTGFTGSRSYSGTLRDTLATPGDYVVTLWTSGDSIATVNGSAGDLLRTVRGWKLYWWTLTNPSVMIVVVTGARMDEVRLHPAGAMMNTYTYDPFVGTVARADASNEVIYYQYDGYRRLKTAHAIDTHTVQQYRYHYLDTIANCTDTAPDWIATGHTRCVKNGNNNNTGEQEEEQKDMNYCSPGYRSLRWVSLGTTGSCPPVPDCTGPDKRVVNGVCETGVKVYTSYTAINSTTWECIYHYEFTDGHWTMNYSELSNSPCLEIIL